MQCSKSPVPPATSARRNNGADIVQEKNHNSEGAEYPAPSLVPLATSQIAGDADQQGEMQQTRMEIEKLVKRQRQTG